MTSYIRILVHIFVLILIQVSQLPQHNKSETRMDNTEPLNDAPASVAATIQTWDNKCSPPIIHTHAHPTKSAQLYHQHWLCQFISNKHNCHDRSSYPNSFQRFLRNRHESMTYVVYLYHPSDTRLSLKLQQRAHVVCSIKCMRT
jgi:hypothetical protein